MALRVQIDEGANGAADLREGSSQTIQRRFAAVHLPEHVGKIRPRFWTGAVVVLGVGVWVISSEGLRLLVPAMGWKFYKLLTPLYYLPLLRRLDTALLFAAILVIAVACVWEKLLGQLLGVETRSEDVKWYRDAERLAMLFLGVGLLVVDACLVYMGVSAMEWGKLKWSFGALLITLAYVLTMTFVSWMRVETRRKLMRLAACLVACVGLIGQGCSLPEEKVVGERESEYVITVLLDLSPSFAEYLADGRAWRVLEAILNRYFSRGGSADDVIQIGRINGDVKTHLWRGTPRDLREQFSSADDLRAFLMKNLGTPGSRVHDSMAASLRRIMRDPNVKSGRAKSGLFVLSDMVEASHGAKASEADVMHAVREFAVMHGVVGLFFVADGLDEHWDDQLKATGIRYNVTSYDEVNPVPPSFE